MARRENYPTKKPLPAFTDAEVGFSGKSGADVKDIPWIDMHQHTQTLTWEQHEKLDVSGARAVVMIAASYFQLPYRPIPATDWRALWDTAIWRSQGINRNHFFDVFLAMGIHMGARIEDVDELLDILPKYCALAETKAIGETGVDPVQRGDGARWDLEEQKRVVRKQMQIGADQELPVLIHTPKSVHETPRQGNIPVQFGTTMNHKFGQGTPHSGPLFDLEDAKQTGVEIDVELADEAGLPDELLVLQHADESIVEYVLESTDCYLSFSLIRSVEEIGPELVAQVIDEYGPEQVLVDTDMLSGLYADDAAFTMKRMILDLLRLGVSPEDVKTVVYENPCELLGLEYPE